MATRPWLFSRWLSRRQRRLARAAVHSVRRSPASPRASSVSGSNRVLAYALLIAAFLLAPEIALAATAEDGSNSETRADPVRELRVCADPDNLPFSNQQSEGFENRIAEVIATDLKATLHYTWYGQRKGFLRKTLKAGACDVVIGVPTGYEPVLSTRPYYSSSYVFVYQKARHFDLQSFDDAILRQLKIGLHDFGNDGANSPPAQALNRRGLSANVVAYSLPDTDHRPAGEIITAVAAGEIDVAIVWGPFAGAFAKKQKVALEIVPVTLSVDATALPFNYDISMAVRRGDLAFKQELDAAILRRSDEIRQILDAYSVPVLGTTSLAFRL
jgi:quinoprotein dehydrogenase-associated probable ABC transporter substrate-binding protein